MRRSLDPDATHATCCARHNRIPASQRVIIEMCGRFNLRTSAEGIIQCFLPGLSPADAPEIPPRYNIAPTQNIVAVFHPEGDAGRQLSYFRWGLLPPWAAELTIGNRMINARSETVAEKRSFKKPFHSQRCVIPADGYYEWKRVAGGKQPYEFHRVDHSLLAMAGLWEVNRRASEDGKPIYSCTILTTEANKTAADIHDRMPVLLGQNGIERWLDRDLQDTDQLQSLCVSAPDDWLAVHPVNKQLGNVRNEGPELLECE